MATAPATAVTEEGSKDGSVKKVTWTITGTDDGSPIPFAEWADRSVQFVGTWGGGTMVWEGSNDGGTTWFTLTDPQGSAISKTGNALEGVVEITELARPRASVSVGSIVVSAILRRQNSMRS